MILAMPEFCNTLPNVLPVPGMDDGHRSV
jgi:hypothetical protein